MQLHWRSPGEVDYSLVPQGNLYSGFIAHQIIDEDTSTGNIPFTINDVETVAGDLIVSGHSSRQELVPDGNITIEKSGENCTIKLNPADNQSRTAIISVSLNDGADTVTKTFVMTVRAVNDRPVFTKGLDQTVEPGAGLQTINGWATNISAGSAEDSQNLEFHLSNNNTSLFSTQPSVSQTGTLTYAPVSDKIGTAQVTIYLKDDGGTANGGQDTSAEQVFSICISDLTAPTVADGNISVSGISPTGAALSWNRGSDNLSAQNDLEYGVYRSASNNIDNVENIESNGLLIGSFTKNIDTINVSGLTPDTQYYFNIIVRDEAGNKTAYTMAGVKTIKNDYTVSFNSQGGSAVDSINASYDTTITAPTKPTRTGYSFGGWYKEAGCTNAWNFAVDKVPAEDITLYAKWTINSYLLTYSAGEHGTLIGNVNQTVTYGADGTEVEAVADEGYYFKCWSDGITTAKRRDINITENLNLTARFDSRETSVNNDFDNLDIVYAEGDSAEHVTRTLYLATRGTSGNTGISWESSHPTIGNNVGISATSRVTCPEPNAADILVTLTATITD
ncbi:MAG: InlB B-repeat-containing protein [Bacillota bacterium]|nr:InlB B-repeat-containing protein [Bacillota bacterium]